MKRLLLVLASALLAVSCMTDPADMEDAAPNVAVGENDSALTRSWSYDDDVVRVPARKLPNPYDIDNIEEALRRYIAAMGGSAGGSGGGVIVGGDALREDEGSSGGDISTQSGIGIGGGGIIIIPPITPPVFLPTHYHIRFRPTTDTQYFRLLQDESLDFFSYPMDVEEEDYAIAYDDPEQDPDGVPYLWVCVPRDHPMSYAASYPRDTVSKLYLRSDGTPMFQSLPTGGSGSDLIAGLSYDELIALSLEVAEERMADGGMSLMSGGGSGDGDGDGGGDGGNGNTTMHPTWLIGGPQLAEGDLPGYGGGFSGQPEGRIRVWDDLLEAFIPLEGVKVRARQNMFKTNKTYTGEDGWFKINKIYNNDFRYSIIWETNWYDIRQKGKGQAYFHGSNMYGVWGVDIVDGNSLRHATIHRAAYRYFYKTQVLNKATFDSKLKITYNNENSSGYSGVFKYYWLDTGWGIMPDIRIWRSDEDGTIYSTDEIFSTACHEITHATHETKVGRWVFWNMVKDYILESWARTAEWALSVEEYQYRGLGELALSRINSYQRWDGLGSGNSRWYSPIFIDLVDDNDQSINHNGSINYDRPRDAVTGYTLENINNFVYTIFNKSSLRGTLINTRPTGVTEAQIDTLLVRYLEVWEND